MTPGLAVTLAESDAAYLRLVELGIDTLADLSTHALHETAQDSTREAELARLALVLAAELHGVVDVLRLGFEVMT